MRDRTLAEHRPEEEEDGAPSSRPALPSGLPARRKTVFAACRPSPLALLWLYFVLFLILLLW